MVRRRSACLLLSITTAVRRDRPTGERATERHTVFAADRRGSEARNLRPLKFASGLDPDEKLEAIEDAGPAALRQRPFDLPPADCRPKGLSVMESQISKVYAPSNATGRQLTITKIAHKAGIVCDARVRTVLATLDMTAERCRSANLDRGHNSALSEADVASIGPHATPHRGGGKYPPALASVPTRPLRQVGGVSLVLRSSSGLWI